MASTEIDNLGLIELIRAIGVPPEVSIYGAVPFGVAFLLSIIAASLYVRYHWKSREYDRPAAVIATLGIWFAMLTAFLLPVDVFLVSFMKHENGTFKEWAILNTTRQSIEQGVAYTYFALYGVILLFVFFLLPLVYFAHEEQDDDQPYNSRRFLFAMKSTAIFIISCCLLFTVGALISYEKIDAPTSNSTEWEDKIWNVFQRMYDDRMTEGLLFVVNILIFIGMITLIIYLGVGLSVFPVNSIRGWRSLKSERVKIFERKTSITNQISRLQCREGSLTSKEKRKLSTLQEEERHMTRMEQEIDRQSGSIFYKLGYCFRVLGVINGFFGATLGIIIWIAILLSNINRLLNSLGYKNGYIASELKIARPLDFIMIELQKVYPLDYVMFFGIIVYLVACSISGVRYLGIWCFCIRLFKIRPHKTQPQGLIMLCTILMFTVLAMNFIIHSAAPQYMAFGHQHYVQFNETTGKNEIKECIETVSQDLCVMSRASTFILNYAVNFWFFGLCYFWMSWAFLAMTVISFFIVVMREKRSSIEEAVDRDDFDESDSDVQPLVA